MITFNDSRSKPSVCGPTNGLSTQAHLLTLSASDPETLATVARAYRQLLVSAGQGAGPSLGSLCFTSGLNDAHQAYRLALVGCSPEQWVEQLTAFLKGETKPGMACGHSICDRPPRLVFVFSGHGAQWPGMGRELWQQEPVFCQALERCDRALKKHASWSLLQELTTDQSPSRLARADIVQPLLFAIQVALAALWRSWGIEPQAVLGQSIGEVAAAHVAGALSLEDAAWVICRQSQLARRMNGQGGMIVVGLPSDQARHLLLGYQDRVSLNAILGPASVAMSGDATVLDEIMGHLERKGIFCRRVKIDYPSHSTQMASLSVELLPALQGLQPQPPRLPFYSTVTGEAIGSLGLDAAYWARNLREPMLVWAAVQRLLADGYDHFLEVSPHPILSSAIQQGLSHLGQPGIVLSSLRRDQAQRATMLASLGTLYTCGCAINWQGLYPSGERLAALPASLELSGGNAQPSASQDESARARPTIAELTRETLLTAGPEEGPALLEAFICQQLTGMLSCSTSDLDMQQSLTGLGLDSLMAAELVRQVEIHLGVAIPMTRLLENLSIAQLAAQVRQQLTMLPVSLAASPATRESAERLLTNLDRLSDEQVDALLGHLLAERESDG